MFYCERPANYQRARSREMRWTPVPRHHLPSSSRPQLHATKFTQKGEKTSFVIDRLTEALCQLKWQLHKESVSTTKRQWHVDVDIPDSRIRLLLSSGAALPTWRNPLRLSAAVTTMWKWQSDYIASKKVKLKCTHNIIMFNKLLKGKKYNLQRCLKTFRIAHAMRSIRWCDILLFPVGFNSSFIVMWLASSCFMLDKHTNGKDM